MKILVTGATGYIGGSVADRLCREGHEVTGLTRTPEQAQKLKARGILPVIGSLDEAEKLADAARAADAVIHAASADDFGAVVTLVTALEGTGKTLIHTSGSAIVADGADGTAPDRPPLTEDDAFTPQPFRRARVDMNRYVRQAALDKAVRSIVICPTMVYGTGRGLQPDSDQIPKLIGLSRQLGKGVYFGAGDNRYSNVHIDDLAGLYLLALERAPGGSFFFAENGSASFREIAGMIAARHGLNGTQSLPVAEITRQFGEAGRLGVASNSLVRAANARRLGWLPQAETLAEWLAR